MGIKPENRDKISFKVLKEKFPKNKGKKKISGAQGTYPGSQ